MHDLRLRGVNLRLLLSDLLLDVRQLVLQRLYYLLCDSLLLLQLAHTREALLPPVLVLLPHAVDVIRHEVDTLPQGVRALAQDLNRLLHELDVILGETATWLARLRGGCTSPGLELLGKLLRLFAPSSGCRLLSAQLVPNLDTTPCSRCVLPLIIFIVVLLHELLCLLDECTMLLSSIELHPLLLLLLE